MVDLSILIPARNEQFLSRTIQDITEHAEGSYEVIAVLDGEWVDPPVAQHHLVTILYYPESIGQRAATNRAAAVSTGKYLMKVDAHCSFDQGFDVKLLADMQDDWTMAPLMKNLHAFDWVCPDARPYDGKDDPHRRYQGPSGPCIACGKPTTQDVLWIAKPSPQSTAYRFDRTLHFQYFPELKKRQGSEMLVETMSLQGSCFLLSREKYFELNICDEALGSWGNQGTEVACKTWLSGGRVIVNKNTWYSHLFRTQGGSFGFPYPISGRQVERARQITRELFLGNSWDKAVRPFSWILKKFWPIPDWTEEDLQRVLESDAVFFDLHPKLVGVLGVVGSVPSPVADHTTPVSVDGGREEMPIPAMSLSELSGGSTVAPKNILSIGDESQMGGVATSLVVTDMINNRDILTLPTGDGTYIHRVHQPMNSIENLVDSNLTIPVIETSSPNPASSVRIDSDLGKDFIHNVLTESRNSVHNTVIRQNNKLVKGIVYYTDNKADPVIMKACQEQILKSVNGERVVSVSLKPLSFGDNIVLSLERGYLTMFKQILAGLEASNADVIFFCEHDVLYHPSHFEFIPPRDDTIYYNTNVWKVRYSDGHALHYDCKQTSGLCAYRELLVEHYRKRVANTEATLKDCGSENRNFRNWIRRQGFEPGTHHRNERVDDLGSDAWQSKYPILDIRHDSNLTPNRWSIDEFRRKPHDWVEADEVKGWGKTRELMLGIREP